MIRRQKEISPLLYLSASLVTLTVFSGLVLSSIPASADDDTVIDEVNISIPVSCSLSGTGMNTHTATMDPNTYNDGVNHAGIGSTTLTAYCNDPNGFAIYAVGYTNDEVGNTDLEGTTTSYTIPTGTATSGATSNWSMKLASVSGTYAPIIAGSISDTEKQSGDPDYSTFVEVPDDYERVAYRTAGTDIGQSATGSQLTTSYAVFVSGTQAPGTYVGQVLYTLVHPYNGEAPTSPQTTASGKICYYPNGQNVVGTMGCPTVSSSATSAYLLASNFSRQGYGFAGWSDVNDYATNPNAHFYGPQEYITFTAGQYTGNNPGLSLYAVWIKSEGSLQDSNKVASVCSRLTQSGPNITRTLNSVSALTDLRDNETYAIAKLADGNCWMIENLRLDNTATGNSDGSLAQGYVTGFIGLANSEAPTLFRNEETANSLYSTDGSTASTISGSGPSLRIPRYNNANTPSNAADRPQNPSSDSATNTATNAGMYSYGNYYNWTAASTDIVATSEGDYNTKSICPTGWSIPRGGNKSREATNDFWKYIVTGLNSGVKPANYDSQSASYYVGSTSEADPIANALKAYPNNFVFSGVININAIEGRGSGGHYWSSSTITYSAYGLSFGGHSSVYPGTYDIGKYYGQSVRCFTPGS